MSEFLFHDLTRDITLYSSFEGLLTHAHTHTRKHKQTHKHALKVVLLPRISLQQSQRATPWGVLPQTCFSPTLFPAPAPLPIPLMGNVYKETT